MIRTYSLEQDRCRLDEGVQGLDAASGIAWIDVLHPDPEEERAVERAVGVGIPTREEMAEIEETSRLYHEQGAAVMIAPLLVKATGDYPETTDVTFVLTDQHLVTVRYGEPRSLAIFAATAQRRPEICAGPNSIFVALLDAVVDRIADVLEEAGRDLDALSRETFANAGVQPDLRAAMRRLGRDGEIVSKARESLVGLARLLAFAEALPSLRGDTDNAPSLSGLARDAEVLLQHATSLADKSTFLLDALLGMINIEQNAIIKTFSVVAVMFLPPTLIASIYGMNFEHMPELDWRFGYPLALLVMVGSMIAPYLFFKKKGWI
ncbi:magnesium transporter CorA family protein [Roseitranquillus sediminis]|uniref:magnesium transporter CorA family protein n=1 Tax=Roseitranquillus sediminis TaxID=2809051 RepID=UPI001D0CB4CB|nr:magnesium transporter CorA family protein [Roseitranquillus sediminis]MBM9595652.1 magnesium transporter CorA family protein [Roseitranquillus sediminis]